jgi:hypothetical protein
MLNLKAHSNCNMNEKGKIIQLQSKPAVYVLIKYSNGMEIYGAFKEKSTSSIHRTDSVIESD